MHLMKNPFNNLKTLAIIRLIFLSIELILLLGAFGFFMRHVWARRRSGS